MFDIAFDSEPNSYVERIHRSQEVMLRAKINPEHDDVIRKMLAEGHAEKAEVPSWETAQLSVTVIAKIPYSESEAREMMRSEGRNYSVMPDYLSEGREGYIQTKPMHQPMPCCAAIPKFYGMYVDKNNVPLLLLEECGEQIKPRKLKKEHQ